MSNIFFVLCIVWQIFNIAGGEPCKSNIKCINEYQYKICVNIAGEATLQGSTQTCENNLFCSDTGSFPCIESKNGIVEVAPPNCTKIGKFPATLCNEYYECVPVFNRYEPRLTVCPEEQAFNRSAKDCTPAEPLKCTVPPFKKPDCTAAGNFSANQCNQYYECKRLWWWFEPHLQTCSSGEGFDKKSATCVPSSLVGCDIGNPITEPPPPVTEPPCPTAGKLPANQCNQYYECVGQLWWYTPELRTCAEGYAFDPVAKACGPAGPLNCAIGVPTTEAPTTLPPIEPPACKSSSRSPADKCTEYYECVPVFWWWEPRLKVCEEGKAFDANVTVCIAIEQTNCKIGLPTTTILSTTLLTTTTTKAPIQEPACGGPTRHEGPQCNQYYQCVNVLWWYEPRLYTCEPGNAFDLAKLECLPAGPLNCEIGVPTTTTTSTTTLAPTTTTTEKPVTLAPTTPQPIPPPACNGPSKHPATNCNEYYQCVSNLWWWEPRLYKCEAGKAFDVKIADCGPAEALNCILGVPTTTQIRTDQSRETFGKAVQIL